MRRRRVDRFLGIGVEIEERVPVAPLAAVGTGPA
jgi:hypothetical protein